MLLRHLTFTVLALLLGLLAGPGRAADLVESRSYWRDDSASASFETARQQSYTPFRRVFSGGYTSAAHWFRLRIGPSKEDILLRIRPQYLDSITVYDPVGSAAGAFKAQSQVGDLHPISGGGAPSLSHAVRLTGTPQARDVWLRLESRSTHMMLVDVYTLVEGLRSESRWLGGFSVTLGLIVLTVLWALINLPGRSDVVMRWFAFKQAVLAINFALYTGLFRLIAGEGIAPATVSHMTSLFILLSVLTASLFELIFLREFKPPPRLYRLGWLFWLPCLLNLLWFLLVDEQNALEFNAVFLLLFTVAATVLGFKGQVWRETADPDKPVLPRRWLMSYYLALIAALGMAISAVLGLVDAGGWGLIGPLAYAVISGFFMIGLLQMRSNLLLRAQRNRSERLNLAEASAHLERSRREEQARFMAMLAHELKTPLSVVRMVIGSSQPAGMPMWQEAHWAIDDMRALIDRCMQAEKVEDGAWVPQIQTVLLDDAVRYAVNRSPAGAVRLDIVAASVQSDPTIVHAIFSNLIDNAVKYRAPDSVVSVELAAEGRQWRLRVSNQPGPAGWPDDQRVFEKYYRSPGAHRETGSGLGLYLVARLAELIGGTVKYSPSATEVVFELWLPQTESP